MNSLKLKLDVSELYKLNEFIHEIISKEDFHVDLIVEEIFVNIVEYSKGDFVNVNAEFNNSALTVEFVDNGIEFNPILKDNPETPETIDGADIGGLGIYLTKQFADEIFYDYLNGENHLKVVKIVE